MKAIVLFSALLLPAVCLPVLAQPPGVPYQGFGPGPTGDRYSVQKGMRFERHRDQNGYQLRILTRGMDPEAVQVSIQGRSLVVQNRESHQVEQQSDSGSYRFATTSSNMRRRFPLPPDADAAAMKRSVDGDVVVITLPYLRSPRY